MLSLYLGTLAMIFDFAGGFINAVNFGFAAFVGLGAYIAAMLSLYTHLNSWLGLIVALLVTGLIGFLTGLFNSATTRYLYFLDVLVCWHDLGSVGHCDGQYHTAHAASSFPP